MRFSWLLGSTALLLSTPAWANDPQAPSPPPKADAAAAQTDAPGQDQHRPAASPQVAATPAPSATGVGGIAPAITRERYAHFDSFLEPGQTTTFPGSAETVLGDVGGFRSWLSDRDIGFRAVQSVTMAQDLLPTGQPRSPQRFNGQRFTLQTVNGNFNMAFGLRALGLPNTKILFGGAYIATSYEVNGPNTAWIRTLAVYQSFFNDHLTIKAGFTPNFYEYVGFFTGGSPILASGLPGLLPIQAGLGVDPAAVPLVNVTAYGAKGSYLRVGVQRSLDPLGVVHEVHNRGWLQFSQKGAGALYIGELGIRRPATEDGRQIWLRVGGFFNDSDYKRFDKPGRTGTNASFYALGDRQITQPDKSRPARGLYVGASAFWIPKSVNTSTQSYEGRIFTIGAIKSRPMDTASLRVTWTKFSRPAREAYAAQDLFTNKDQLNATVSYSARLVKGLFLTPSLSYIHHPAFIGDFKDAVNLSGALFILF